MTYEDWYQNWDEKTIPTDEKIIKLQSKDGNYVAHTIATIGYETNDKSILSLQNKEGQETVAEIQLDNGWKPPK